MWQRIQTLYLAISTGLITALFFCDKADGISYRAYVPYLILLIVITLLNVLALTSCRFRVFQARTAVLSAIITIALQAWLAVDFFVTGNDPVFHVSAVFPVVAVILDILAALNIWSDELMVRNADRLRSAKRRSRR